MSMDRLRGNYRIEGDKWNLGFLPLNGFLGGTNRGSI